MNNKVTFAALDKMLAGLAFHRAPLDGTHFAYEHLPSDTLLVVPRRRPADPVDEKTLIVVRKMLVEKGLIEPGELDSRLATL